MKSRVAAALVTFGAVVASLLSALPAEAAPMYTAVPQGNIVMNSAGDATVLARCSYKAKSTCGGAIWFVDENGGPIEKRFYSIPRGEARNIVVGVPTASENNPYNTASSTDMGDIRRVYAKMHIEQNYPNKATTQTVKSLDTRLDNQRQQIVGDVTAALGSNPVDDIKLSLFSRVRGGNLARVGIPQRPDSGGNFQFSVGMGANNLPVTSYYMQIEGKSDGVTRTWWWRGHKGTMVGGSHDFAGASQIILDRYSDYVLPINYGFIYGNTNNVPGVDISIVAPPGAFPPAAGSSIQSLDVERCGNVFGSDKSDSNGNYRVDFLPSTEDADTTYAVQAQSGSNEMWTGADGKPYASCHGVTKYAYNKDNLVRVPLGIHGPTNVPMAAQSGTIFFVKNPGSMKVKTANDLWVTVREFVPGINPLDSPVVWQGPNNGLKVHPGRYWVDVGMRQGCSSWVPSRYPDNAGIFKDEARDSERWKTVSGAAAEYGKSYAMGYVKRNPPKGYKGWMYREYCGSFTSGSRVLATVAENGSFKTNSRLYTGGTVVGHVKRRAGKTAKEMLVTIYKIDGKTVLRTDLTDGSGRFSVKGLPSGTYKIGLNLDSWRGNKQSFSGRKTIKVRQGHTVSAGTFVFQA